MLIRTIGLLLAAFVSLGIMHGVGIAQTRQSAQVSSPPEKVQELINLLADPEVQAWLETKPAAAADESGSSIATRASEWEAQVRNRFVGLKNAFPRIPEEMANAADIVTKDVNAGRPGTVIAIVSVLIALGYGAEWLFRRAVLGTWRDSGKIGVSGVRETSQGIRALSEVTSLVVFAIASTGLFLVFEWPPSLRKVVLTYLLAFIAFRVVTTLGRLLIAPDRLDQAAPEAQFRILQISNFEARSWYRRLVLFAGILMFGWATVSLMPALGFSADVVRLAAYFFGLGLLAVAIGIVWRRPSVNASRVGAREWLLTVYLVILWLVWTAGSIGLLWLGIYALLLPKVISGAGHAAQALAGTNESNTLRRSISNVLIVRGVRALVIAAAVAWLAFVWRFGPAALSGNETVQRLVGGLLNGVIILLFADLLWNLSKAYITHKLEIAGANDAGSPDDGARRARLRTLLPTFRNALAVLIATVAVLTVLSGLGVQIAPLIAGAGIFGVAIGFGSQTLVKDVISGVFYMLDDAFRVGEYIQSGSYKGTVESFSLRSVKLRHHRGPVFTVPFGSLGAVQNMSRDWVIDKFMIRVPFDTDIQKVKKLVKGIGAELKADPELAPEILETVKMKGVEEIGDFGIQLSFAFMAKPGHQSVVRRRAYTMIQQAFAANGIHFAQPTVQVGGDEKQAAAAATASALARKPALEVMES